MDWADELLAQQAQWNEIIYWAHYEEPVFQFVYPGPAEVMKMLDDRLYVTNWSWEQNHRDSIWGMPQYGCNMRLTTLSKDLGVVEEHVRALISDLEIKGVWVKLMEFKMEYPNTIEIHLSMMTENEDGMQAVRNLTYERLRL